MSLVALLTACISINPPAFEGTYSLNSRRTTSPQLSASLDEMCSTLVPDSVGRFFLPSDSCTSSLTPELLAVVNSAYNLQMVLALCLNGIDSAFPRAVAPIQLIARWESGLSEQLMNAKAPNHWDKKYFRRFGGFADALVLALKPVASTLESAVANDPVIARAVAGIAGQGMARPRALTVSLLNHDAFGELNRLVADLSAGCQDLGSRYELLCLRLEELISVWFTPDSGLSQPHFTVVGGDEPVRSTRASRLWDSGSNDETPPELESYDDEIQRSSVRDADGSQFNRGIQSAVGEAIYQFAVDSLTLTLEQAEETPGVRSALWFLEHTTVPALSGETEWLTLPSRIASFGVDNAEVSKSWTRVVSVVTEAAVLLACQWASIPSLSFRISSRAVKLASTIKALAPSTRGALGSNSKLLSWASNSPIALVANNAVSLGDPRFAQFMIEDFCRVKRVFLSDAARATDLVNQGFCRCVPVAITPGYSGTSSQGEAFSISDDGGISVKTGNKLYDLFIFISSHLST